MNYPEDYINKVIQGDSLEVLKTFDDESVDCCITSPPYWGLRDYGVDGQLGLEKTPEEYVAKMVEVFRECKRVLKKEGTLWLNLGDSYAGSGKGRNGDGTAGKAGSISKQSKGQMSGILKKSRFDKWNSGTKDSIQVSHNTPKAEYTGLKPKDLVGIPWRVAFALQADGWYLRQDIIWAKPNPMPESVTDRCTKSHEYIFLMSKSPKYYFDNEAIKEKAIYGQEDRKRNGRTMNMTASTHKNLQEKGQQPHTMHVNRATGIKFGGNKYGDSNDPKFATKSGNDIDNGNRNKRSVWTVTTKPFAEAHFATFPKDLIEPMVKTTRPDSIILDPFMGSGTTALVAKNLGRKYIGIELNPEYIKIAENRLKQDILL